MLYLSLDQSSLVGSSYTVSVQGLSPCPTVFLPEQSKEPRLGRRLVRLLGLPFKFPSYPSGSVPEHG